MNALIGQLLNAPVALLKGATIALSFFSLYVRYFCFVHSRWLANLLICSCLAWSFTVSSFTHLRSILDRYSAA